MLRESLIGVYFDLYVCDFDKYSWKTLENSYNKNTLITKKAEFFEELSIQWNVYMTQYSFWFNQVNLKFRLPEKQARSDVRQSDPAVSFRAQPEIFTTSVVSYDNPFVSCKVIFCYQRNKVIF